MRFIARGSIIGPGAGHPCERDERVLIASYYNSGETSPGRVVP